MNKRCLKDAFRVTVPVLLGYITCGIPFDLTGVDFALTALFAVLTVDQFSKFLHRPALPAEKEENE